MHPARSCLFKLTLKEETYQDKKLLLGVNSHLSRLISGRCFKKSRQQLREYPVRIRLVVINRVPTSQVGNDARSELRLRPNRRSLWSSSGTCSGTRKRKHFAWTSTFECLLPLKFLVMNEENLEPNLEEDLIITEKKKPKKWKVSPTQPIYIEYHPCIHRWRNVNPDEPLDVFQRIYQTSERIDILAIPLPRYFFIQTVMQIKFFLSQGGCSSCG